ncbi:hypothetical protein CQW23_08920 [Capsicum baccatum]|uniref:Uncharacterized protein n=1 Tax=Capsicum baccatum TaxID=33114 RepID=A0A2G2XAF1_CAPBA|nr:hypothetical protein CQW23_08920 [Capsicum baccatum]
MENRKRGREISDQKSTNRKLKRKIMMTSDNNDDVDQISYKWENFMRKEKYHDNEMGGRGVFDFPWIKGSGEVNFRAEIDECLESTLAVASTSSYNYYNDREIDIATDITTTTPLNFYDNGFFDDQKLLLAGLDIDLDFNLDLDLIGRFFNDNLLNVDTEQSSRDHDQVKMNKIVDQQLKIEVNGDKKTVEPKAKT